MRAIATMVTLVAVLSAIRADNQPAAARPVKHLLIFKNIGEFPEYLFYVCPDELQQAKSAIRVPESGQVTISEIDAGQTTKGIFIFAVPKKLIAKVDDPPKVEWFRGDFAGVYKSKLPVELVQVVDQTGSKFQATEYRIIIADGLSIRELGRAGTFAGTDYVQTAPDIYHLRPTKRQLWVEGGAILGVAAMLVCYLVLQRLSRRR